MLYVTEKYKQVVAEPIRPTTQFRGELEIMDRAAEGVVGITTTDASDYTSSIFDSTNQGTYIMMDSFPIGTGALIAPDNTNDKLKTGWISNRVSLANYNFSGGALLISIAFPDEKEFIGITFKFKYFYPKDITITTSLNGTVVQTIPMEANGLDVECTTRIEPCDRIQFTFNNMRDPATHEGVASRRLRIERISLGLMKYFTTNDIISTTHNLSIDPISTVLPLNKFSMKVANFSREYNPDNPEGIWRYFINGQAMRVKYGVQVDGGIEWLNYAYLHLSDAPKVAANSATFEARDEIANISGTYYRGKYYEDGISLYDLAEEVLYDANVENYNLPQSLTNIYTKAPLPMLPHNQCLQLIANAGRCVMYCDNDGVITMKTQVETSISVDDNGHAEWSDAASAYYGTDGKEYITFEPSHWRIGDTRHVIMPSSQFLATGYTSDVIADADGYFSQDPQVTVTYSLPISSDKFTLAFDTINDLYPKAFTLEFYDNEYGTMTLLNRYVVTDNASATWTTNDDILDYTVVVLTFNRWCQGYNRARLTGLNPGDPTDYYLNYDVALDRPQLTRATELKQVDVTVHEYTVDDDTTVLFEENVSGTDEIVIDHLPATNIQVSGQGFGWQTEYDDLGGLVHLVSEDGKVTVTGHDTYYEFWEWVQISEISDNVFPIDWANTHTCYLACDVDNPDGLDCHIMCIDNMDYDTIIMATTSGSYRGLWVNEIETDTVGFDIYIQFSTTPSTVTISNIRLLDSNNNVIWKADANTFAMKTDANHKLVGAFAQRTIVKLAGEGTVKVTGNVLLESEKTHSVYVSDTGEPCPIDNPLITDDDNAEQLGKWLASYIQQRDTYTVPFRQDYRVEVDDIIYIQTEFDQHVPARVVKLDYALPGQKGKITVKRLD